LANSQQRVAVKRRRKTGALRRGWMWFCRLLRFDRWERGALQQQPAPRRSCGSWCNWRRARRRP